MQRAVTEINVTPMIDVLLVLLIVFMVAVPVAQRRLDATLPRPADPATTPPPAPHTLMLHVHAERFTLGAEQYLSLEDLRHGLTVVYAGRQDRTLVVRAEKGIRYGRVVSAMDVARGAGVQQLGLVTAVAPSAELSSQP
jgi:biopolymer transport protein ExbD